MTLQPTNILQRVRTWLAIAAMTLIAGCATEMPEMETVDYVDLERFMGDWYVIASIPTFLEDDAFNAIENYSLNDDGTIATRFTFREDGFDGEHKEYHPKGFVKNEETNALWGMQFVWPIKADYRIVYLDEDYSVTVVARKKRDYVWIMARQPRIAEPLYDELVEFVVSLGYDASELRRVPQQW